MKTKILAISLIVVMNFNFPVRLSAEMDLAEMPTPEETAVPTITVEEMEEAAAEPAAESLPVTVENTIEEMLGEGTLSVPESGDGGILIPTGPVTSTVLTTSTAPTTTTTVVPSTVVTAPAPLVPPPSTVTLATLITDNNNLIAALEAELDETNPSSLAAQIKAGQIGKKMADAEVLWQLQDATHTAMLSAPYPLPPNPPMDSTGDPLGLPTYNNAAQWPLHKILPQLTWMREKFGKISTALMGLQNLLAQAKSRRDQLNAMQAMPPGMPVPQSMLDSMSNQISTATTDKTNFVNQGASALSDFNLHYNGLKNRADAFRSVIQNIIDAFELADRIRQIPARQMVVGRFNAFKAARDAMI